VPSVHPLHAAHPDPYMRKRLPQAETGVAVDHTTAIFAAELILLLFFGRLIGEGMVRIGQPAIFGQLLAGVLLGPSIFGAMLPELRHMVFPETPALKSMIDAVSQIGILLLLLLTGMETNLALVNRKRGAVISTSLFGIAVPFVCGVALAYALPAELIPSTATRLVTALFLGTALSISSVKIVGMVLMEIGAIRRDLGQLILATAILDDSLAWIIIAIISGIAAYGAVNFEHVGMSIGLTALFLAASLTVGKRVVARIIVWCNDNLATEVPVISAILLIMLTMALTTELIGVHSALGAFVAGILIGQSPILSEQIESQLRGFIIAFFSPVFFAVAGLGMDLRTLLDPALLGFTLVVILIASIGKFLGALAGGMVGGLNWLESLALATGLNARGSTEVIIATVGLSMGALSNQLYTMIVAMAVVTTMAMPPTLRWMMGRVPLRDEEMRRLEKEEAEGTESVPQMERALVHVDGSANGGLTAILAGLFAARQGVLTTVLEAPRDEGDKTPGRTRLMEAAKSAWQDVGPPSDKAAPPAPKPAPSPAIEQLVQARPAQADDAIEKEASKGYSIAFVGIDQPISATAPRFEEPLQALVAAFDGPVAILLNGGRYEASADAPLNILVPTGGSADSRLATEIALTLAAASRGTLTALHVFDPREDTLLLRGRARRLGISVLVEAHRLGKRSGVAVKGLTATSPRPETEIRRVVRRGRFDLIVLGTALRHGETKFLGPRTLALVQSLRTPVLLVAR
jgi:Kef-type K+ transport system membrane component KefB/nucleotide-binding universal stress UspA family protein